MYHFPFFFSALFSSVIDYYLLYIYCQNALIYYINELHNLQFTLRPPFNIDAALIRELPTRFRVYLHGTLDFFFSSTKDNFSSI